MKLTPPQAKAYEALRTHGRITSSDSPARFKRLTVEVLARRGLAEMERTPHERVRHHRNGRTSTYLVIAWVAYLLPQRPDDEALAELDMIAANQEWILRPAQREHAAAYIALTAPTVALKDSPAAAPDYSVRRAYEEARNWPVDKLMDQVVLLRHLSGEHPVSGDTPPDTGTRTDVWTLTASSDGPRPGQELGQVRADTENGAALRGNSLLNVRGGYQMRRLGSREVSPGWVEDFRARGLVLRLEAMPDGEDSFRVIQVADGRTLVVRHSAETAKRDALADLTALYSALGPQPPAPAGEETAPSRAD